MSTRALIIIGASQVALANEIAKASFDTGPGGKFSFTVPLFAASAPDDLTPVAYWCSAEFDAAHWPIVSQFSAQFTDPIIVQYDEQTSPGTPDSTLAANGLRRAKSQIP